MVSRNQTWKILKKARPKDRNEDCWKVLRVATI